MKSRKSAAPPAPVALPDRQAIADFIARERAAGNLGKIGKREIARAFHIRGDARVGLKRLLADLEAEAPLERGPLAAPARLAPVLVVTVTSLDADGELVAVTSEDKGKPQQVLVITTPGDAAAAAPGIGDRLLVRLLPGHKGTGRPHARLVRRLPTAPRATTLGIFRAGRDGSGGRIIPVDKKIHDEYIVAAADTGDALDGELVALAPVKAGRYGLQRVRVMERIGQLDSEKALSLIAINTHGIRDHFPEAVLRDAQGAKPVRLPGHDESLREDWRDLALITIDPADAKDHDDAVHAARDDNPDNAGGYVLTIAIADVAAYVLPGSAMDREALARGNSVYFPDRVVPMLPERLSNDLCSLRQGDDRPALALRATINAAGTVLATAFHRIMMRSHARLSYEEAQALQDGGPDPHGLRAGIIAPLFAAWAALSRARNARAPLDLDLPERKLLLDAAGRLDRVIVPPHLDAHRLIEDFMILANVAAAETLERHHLPLLYRVHSEPTAEKINALATFLATLDIKLARGQVMRPAQFNGILAQVRGTAQEALVNEVVLRSQSQAEYSVQNIGHFGLNLRRYAHFTSPIRRYADLCVHRALIFALQLERGAAPLPDQKTLRDIAESVSLSERRAMLAERDTKDRLIASHLASEIGASFVAQVSSVTRAGLFVRLTETGADGFIPASTLGNDYFVFDEARRSMIGKRSGAGWRLGDTIEVRLVEAAPFAGALRFEMLSEAQGSGQAATMTRDKWRDSPGKKFRASRRRR
ncbi:MAG: ribonuclease R [Hyphomicrobiales bacterium]|nr:ribonuclease R [Hyphomicrobiales bacterium]